MEDESEKEYSKMPVSQTTLFYAVVLSLIIGIAGVALSTYTVLNVNTHLATLARNRSQAQTAPQNITLSEGQSIDVDCTSWNLLANQKGRTTMTISCAPLGTEPVNTQQDAEDQEFDPSIPEMEQNPVDQ